VRNHVVTRQTLTLSSFTGALATDEDEPDALDHRSAPARTTTPAARHFRNPS
jgi:uncharacterized protein (DUF952 family)